MSEINGGTGEDRIIHLMIAIKDSLEREIHAVGDSLAARFDNQAARLDRQAGLMQTGNRWISRINDWSEKLDAAMEVKDRQIAELRARIEAIEKLHGDSGSNRPNTPPPPQ